MAALNLCLRPGKRFMPAFPLRPYGAGQQQRLLWLDPTDLDWSGSGGPRRVACRIRTTGRWSRRKGWSPDRTPDAVLFANRCRSRQEHAARSGWRRSR